MLSFKKRFITINRNDGFSVVELLVSMVIILLIATVVTPLVVFTAQTSQYNRVKITAKNLANERVEEIRAMNFADIEVGYNKTDPPVLFDGREFVIETNIYWKSQSGCLCLGDDDIDWDLKGLSVIVTSGNLFNNDSKFIKEEVHTQISRDHEQPLYQGATLVVCVGEGLPYIVSDMYTPVQGIPVTIEGLQNDTVMTSNTGSALFLDLEVNEGEGSAPYTIELGLSDMITFPGSFPMEDEMVYYGNTKKVNAYVAKPCSLKLSLKDLVNNPIVINDNDYDIGNEPTLIILEPYGSIDEHATHRSLIRSFNGTDTEGNVIPSDIFSELWPFPREHANAYSFDNIDIPGHLLSVKGVWDVKENERWMGYFDDGAGTVKDLIIYLWPIPDFDLDAASSWMLAESVNIDTSLSLEERVAFYENQEELFILRPGVFNRERNNNKLQLAQSNGQIDFLASQIYFKGDSLDIGNGWMLSLHGNYFRFENEILIGNTGNIKLSVIKTVQVNEYEDYDLLDWPTVYKEDGVTWDCLVPKEEEVGMFVKSISGSELNDYEALENSSYGTIFFEKDVHKGPGLNNSDTIIGAGSYYFPDGFNFSEDWNKTPEQGGLIKIADHNN